MKGKCKLNEISLKRKRFARFFADCHDIRLSAMLCGCSSETAYSEGLELLRCKSVRRQINRAYSERQKLSDDIRTGLEKIAFGRCNDAVKLAFSESDFSGKQIDLMELFCISSIKRDKDGGVDIKLTDRTKALELLMKLDEVCSDTESAEDFLAALKKDCEADNISQENADEQV